MPITVKARDGKTDLYGLMFTPTQLRFDEEVSDHQLHLSRARRRERRQPRSFSAARGDTQALAELGFIVVQIDGMGTPWRSKAFHDAYYGDMGDNTLPDQVAGMKELAAALPVHRHRPRRHLGPLRRRLRHGRRDVPLSRFLQGGHRRVGQPRQPQLRGRLGRAVSGPAREEAATARQLRRPGEPDLREEPEGQAAARARHDGRQRAAVQHAARGGRADQGEQGLRPAHAAQPRATATARRATT